MISIIGTHPCRRNNGECQDFCYPRREQGVLTRICGCRYGRKIDPTNNAVCIDNSQVESVEASCVGRFQCRNGRCIPMNYKCDGGSSFSLEKFFSIFNLHR